MEGLRGWAGGNASRFLRGTGSPLTKDTATAGAGKLCGREGRHGMVDRSNEAPRPNLSPMSDRPHSLDVLFEDNHLLAANKPAMLATMGVADDQESLLTVAKEY